jgi:circadian clock protein KaiC
VSRDRKPTLSLLGTGSAPLDALLGGGIPQRSVVVVAGEPGSGKTVLALQMLFDAARKGIKSVYFTTLSEPAPKVIHYMQLFDFFDADLMHEHIALADLGGCARRGAGPLIDTMRARIEAHEATIVVVDSFRALIEHLPTLQEQRAFIYDLSCEMSGWGACTLPIGEYTRADVAVRPEFAVADGILLLGSEREELTSVRGLEILKLRGMEPRSGRHFFDIDHRGVAVYPRVSAPTSTDALYALELQERASTGVPGLDEALDGGLPRRSTTLLQGGTGTGKTLLGLRFLIEGARLGERGVFFTLEESPAQLRAVATSVGWDLAGHEQAGLISLVYTSPVELSTDRYLRTASAAVASASVRRAVFDSLTTMSLGVPSARRFKELVYALAKHLRSDDVTLLMTSETEQLLGSARLSGDGVSFIADNLLQLRYVEIEGRLDRAIAVIKARGIRHATDARRLVVDSTGLRVVAGEFKDLQGVLTGLPQRSPTGAR